jgi:hypothetical protein
MTLPERLRYYADKLDGLWFKRNSFQFLSGDLRTAAKILECTDEYLLRVEKHLEKPKK